MVRRSTLSVATAALLGFSFGCAGNTNDPNVPGAGTPVEKAPQTMKEWYEQNQMKTKAASKKGTAKSTPEAAPAK
jgi:hypothetical protein